MRSLWVEIQELTGQKSPAEKLSLLLESARPYCLEEEFLAGRAEAFAILNKSRFRAARTFAIAMHDQLEGTGTRNGGIRTSRSGHCVNIECRVAS